MSDPHERREDVHKLVHEYLTASMVMVPLDEPLDAATSTGDALAYLEEHEFDLALVKSDEIRVVYREQLRKLGDKKLELPVKANSNPPRVDRVIEHSLELAAVAGRLAQDSVPLLVVGRVGPAFIVTRSDFTRAAGQMGVLSVLAALDASLDAALVEYDPEGWQLLTEDEQDDLRLTARRACRRGEELPPMRFLNFRQRLRLVRELGLAEKHGLGTQAEHELVTHVRNDIAHGRELESGGQAIDALLIAERLLDALIRVEDGNR